MYLQSNLKSKFLKYSVLVMPVIGLVIIALMLGIVWYWETYGREFYFYQDAVVLMQDVQRGTLITEDMLTTKKVEASQLIEQAILDKEKIIGLEAKQFIPQNAQLHPNYFETPSLMTDEDRYIVRIPNDWLYSIPNTLRRKDRVLFYLMQSDEIFNHHLGKVVMETTVAYVKDSANREVQTVSTQDRMDGSSVISEVLVFLTPEQVETLEKLTENGGKLIVMHSEGEN